MATISCKIILLAIVLNPKLSSPASAGEEASSLPILEKINERLAILEKFHGEILKKLEFLEEKSRKRGTRLVQLLSKTYLESSPPPVKGLSFNGSTTEGIAAAIPGERALAVEIVNYLQAGLSYYQLHLPRGFPGQKASTDIGGRTREIFTFCKNGTNGQLVGRKQKQMKVFESGWPEGVFAYQIGNSQLSLHVFFSTVGRYALALLPRGESVKTLSPIRDSIKSCSAYTHNGSPNSFRCIDDNSHNWNSKKTLLINQDSHYAKLTINYDFKTTILKIDLFEVDI